MNLAPGNPTALYGWKAETMSNVFFVVAVISGGVALGGYIWSWTRLHCSGAEEDQTGKKPWDGADHQAGQEFNAETVVDAPTGRGTSESHPSISTAAVGRQVRQEGWRRALPGLVAAGGMLALLVSAALALLASLPSKLFGIVALAAAVYIVAAELRSFQRALRD